MSTFDNLLVPTGEGGIVLQMAFMSASTATTSNLPPLSTCNEVDVHNDKASDDDDDDNDTTDVYTGLIDAVPPLDVDTLQLQPEFIGPSRSGTVSTNVAADESAQ